MHTVHFHAVSFGNSFLGNSGGCVSRGSVVLLLGDVEATELLGEDVLSLITALEATAHSGHLRCEGGGIDESSK